MEPSTEQIKAAASAANKPGVLSLAIKEKSALYAAYMPYVKGGGLFIPTNKNFKIGEEVFMLLSLVDDPMKLKVVGDVGVGKTVLCKTMLGDAFDPAYKPTVFETYKIRG